MQRHPWFRLKANEIRNARYGTWLAQQENAKERLHGDPLQPHYVIVSGWPAWLRRRHLRAEVDRLSRTGFVLQEVFEGAEDALHESGRCPTHSIDRPNQRVLIGSLVRSSSESSPGRRS